MTELGSAYVRIRPDTSELAVAVIRLEALVREIADALARYARECSRALPPPTEGD